MTTSAGLGLEIPIKPSSTPPGHPNKWFAAAASKPDRPYQNWCFQHAKKQGNCIISLPTGSGKTRIAVRMLLHYKPQMVLCDRVAVFLAPTVALCLQQAEVLSQGFGLRTAACVGGIAESMDTPVADPGDDPPSSSQSEASSDSDNTDDASRSATSKSWGRPGSDQGRPSKRSIKAAKPYNPYGKRSLSSLESDLTPGTPLRQEQGPSKKLNMKHGARERFAKLLNDNDVLVATPGEVMHLLLHSMLTMRQVPILILDEAHHLVGSHPYCVVLRSFVTGPPDQRPYILGLTASPIQLLEKGVESAPCSLERAVGGCIMGAPNMAEVEACVPSPVLVEVSFSVPMITSEVEEALEHLREARELLDSTARHHRCGVLLQKQEMLTSMLAQQHGGAAGVVGSVTSTGTGNVYDMLKNRVAAIEECLREYGLWMALVTAEHGLLSSTDTALALEVEDEDWSTEGQEGDDSPEASQESLTACTNSSNGSHAGSSCSTLSVSERAQLADSQKTRRMLEKSILKIVTGSVGNFSCSPRQRVALERKAALHAVRKVMFALADLSLGEDKEDRLSGVLEGVYKHGLPDVFNGKLAPTAIELRQQLGPERLAQMLGPCSTPLSQQAGHPSTAADDNAFWFSSKLMELMRVLLSPPRSPEAGDTTVQGTMAFFRMKVHAIGFKELLTELTAAQQVGIVCEAFLGDTGSGSLSRKQTMTLQAQLKAMQQFRSGEVNLLLATDVGAEGLDFGSCQRVVLLQPPSDVEKLVQCKGRARQRGGHMIVLMEEGNVEQARHLEAVLRKEQHMIKAIAKRTQRLPGLTSAPTVQAPGAPRRGPADLVVNGAQQGEAANMDWEDDDGAHTYRVLATSACCPASQAHQVVNRFCASLPGNDRFVQLRPQYIMQTLQENGVEEFQAKLVLPSSASDASSTATSQSLVTFQGEQCRSRKLAEATACLKAVHDLHANGQLDDYLVPTSLGTLASCGGLAARIVHEDITGEMPRARLSHRLAACLHTTAQPQLCASPPDPFTRHLYGWVFQPGPQPEQAHRGPLSADIFTLKGPWPAIPTRKFGEGAQDGPSRLGAETVSKQSQESDAEWGSSQLQPFGVLLRAKLPADLLVAFSVWLQGKPHTDAPHALAAMVYLGPVQSTPEEVEALQAVHASLVHLGNEKSKTGTVKGQKAPAQKPPHTAQSVQEAIDLWQQNYRLDHLATCLTAAGRQVTRASSLASRAPPKTKSAENTWFQVVPVAQVLSSVPGPVLAHGPGSSAPRVLGGVDWDAMVRLAQGLVRVQEIVHLGPCGFPCDTGNGPSTGSASTGHPPRAMVQAQAGSLSEQAPLTAALLAALPRLEGSIMLPCFDTTLRCTRLELACLPSPLAGDDNTQAPHAPPGPHATGMNDSGAGSVSAARPGADQQQGGAGPSEVLAEAQPPVIRTLGGSTLGTHRMRLMSICPWLPLTSIPDAAPLVRARLGTKKDVRPNLVLPPKYMAHKAKRAAKEAQGRAAAAAKAAAPVEHHALAAGQGLAHVGRAVGSNHQGGSTGEFHRDGINAAKVSRGAVGAAAPTSVCSGQMGGGSVQGQSSGICADSARRHGQANKQGLQQDSGSGDAFAPLLASSLNPASLLDPAPIPTPAFNLCAPTAPTAVTASMPQRVSAYETFLPSTLLVHPLSFGEWSALCTVPCLLRRLEALAATYELREVELPALRPGVALPPLRDMLMCLTPRSAGEGYSSEGAELLGDCVLDYLAATFLFHALPHKHEGVLTECKVRMVANEVLLRLAAPRTLRQNKANPEEGVLDDATVLASAGMARGAGAQANPVILPLTPYLQARPFEAAFNWGVGALLVDRAGQRSVMKRGKLVSDSVEALIGALFLTLGGAAALRLIPSSDPNPITGAAQAGALPPGGPSPLPGGGTAAANGAVSEKADANGVSSDDADGQGNKKHVRLRLWDHSALAHALVATARSCSQLEILPGSFDVLAAVHGKSAASGTDGETSALRDLDPDVVARVKAAQSRAPADRGQRAADERLAEKLKPLFGYKFKRTELLREALTHCSSPQPPCNQRLEFLGDAALDMVITCHLVAACADATVSGQRWSLVRGAEVMNPGLITDRRNRLVSNYHLSILCARCGLHKSMRTGLPHVRRLTDAFVNDLPNFEARTARDGGIKKKKYGQSTGAPKLLADLVEAVLGAVLIDSGGDLGCVMDVLWGMVEKADMQEKYVLAPGKLSSRTKPSTAPTAPGPTE